MTENDKSQYNLHILKLNIETVLLCSRRGITFQGHLEKPNYTGSYHENRVDRGKFITII